MEKIVAVIPARNEEENIGNTLEGLVNQTHAIQEVVVINDGSTDRTKEIAEEFGIVEVLDRKDRGFDAQGKAMLANTFNDGFTKAVKDVPDYDYILVLGADVILSETYVEGVLSEFRDDDNLMVASGTITGKYPQPTTGFNVYGSGRLIRRSFWKKIGEQYPVKVGWESYPVFKANELGYKTYAFKDYEMSLQRPTGGKTDYYAYGEAMRAYGYFFILAMGRSFLRLLRNPIGGFKMMVGYLRGKERYEQSLRKFVNQIQRKRIKNLLNPFSSSK